MKICEKRVFQCELRDVKKKGDCGRRAFFVSEKTPAEQVTVQVKNYSQAHFINCAV